MNILFLGSLGETEMFQWELCQVLIAPVITTLFTSPFHIF